MKKHNIVKLREEFIEIWEDKKTFEIRKNDADFREKDLIIFTEYNDETDTYTQREIHAEIYTVENLSNGRCKIDFKVIS